jgi:tetratricopeptide (TPR) repeat protein
MFPEYAQAKKNFDEGQFQRAVPDYQRIFEVVQSLNTPQCNPMLLEVTNQLVHSYLYQGQAAKALGVLQTASQLASVTSKEHVVLHLLKSKTHMWSGNFAQSLQSAQKATNTLEALDQEGDIKLFADVYGQLGISHLLLGDIDDAEGYLQMAARWAQTPIQQLRSATNYGSAQLFRAASETPFSLWQRHLRMIEATPSAFFQEFISSSTAKVDAKKIAELNTNISSTVTVVQQQPASSTSPTPTVQDVAPEAKKLIQFALDIWQESVQELINAHSGAADGHASSAAAAAAAAMCGPMSSSSSSATIGMTGLVGDDVRTVPSSSSSPAGETTSTTTTATPHLSLDEALRQDVDLALAYGHLLTNIAEAQDALHPQSSDASHTLSTALTVLTPLSHLPVTQPVLARVLKWIAFHHSRASQNVSAEGLYRSALDKMTTATGTTTTTTGHNSMLAYAQHDARCQYETVVARGLYAQVLQHWERREAQGASLQQDVVTQQLPRVVVSDTRRPLIPSQLVYPC